MGGRGASGLSYQGKNSGSGRASSSGVNVSEMRGKLDSLSSNVLNDKHAAETIEQIYRATVGNSINQNDWVFLSKAQAERWTKTPLGRPKPGVKVIESTVKASEVDWTGKNLEFVYTGKRRRR